MKQLPIVVDGTFFGNEIFCKFGSKVAFAQVFNGTRVICLLPELTDVNITMGLSFNGIDFVSVSGVFTRLKQLQLTRISHSVGSTSTSSAITITGLEFVVGMICWFGNISTPAVVVSKFSASCSSPLGIFGFVRLEISRNGTVSQDGFIYQFVEPLLLVSLSSRSELVDKGTFLLMVGSAFSSLRSSMVKFVSTSFPFSRPLYLNRSHALVKAPAGLISKTNLIFRTAGDFSNSFSLVFNLPNISITESSLDRAFFSGGSFKT